MARAVQGIAVLGAGAWGTALALAAARAGRQVTLWCRRPEQAAALAESRENAAYLPGVTLPESVTITSAAADLAAAEATILAVPAQRLRGVLQALEPQLSAGPAILAAKGIEFEHIDVGGGLGVRYRDEQPTEPEDWARAFLPKLAGRNLKVMTEPGRAIAGNAGILVMRVELIKHGETRHFAVVDAAMNDLLRPSLYQAWMDIVPVQDNTAAKPATYDVVGPVCETGDWLGKDRELAIAEGDLLAVRTAGAYGFVMASNYNSRGRAAAVMVDGDHAHLVRARETFEDLVRGERVLP